MLKVAGRDEDMIVTSPDLYPFSPKSMVIDGHSMSYIDEGQGPVMVMVHGNPTWSFYYRNLIRHLQATYRVIAVDHIGCGMSDKPQNYPYTLENHITNLETLLEKLAIDKCTLVMHDWGGAISMGYAVRNPEKIQSFVIFNTAAFRSQRIPFRISICRWPLLGPLLVRGFNAFARTALFMAVTKSLTRDEERGYLSPYDTWDNRIAILRFVQDIPLSEHHASWKTLVAIEEGLARFSQTPMLILWGGRDFCFTRHFYDEWRRRFPQAEGIFFTDAGHYVLEDAFPQIVPILDGFLARHLTV
ncbi:alpha/beta fold hydrolase [Thermodesulfobacteriota bacterium]